MLIRWIGAVLLCMTTTFACGGDSTDGSGVDPTLELGVLEEPEVDQLCDYSAALVEPRLVDCGDEEIMVEGDAQACIDLVESFGPDCAATVDEMETCFEDIATQTDEQLCAPVVDLPASCDVILDDPTCQPG